MENYNALVEHRTYHYLMQPGDRTMYRFSFGYLDQSPQDNYILESGVGDTKGEYIQASIRMGGGSGVTCLMVSSLRRLLGHPEELDILRGYAMAHGWRHVDDYTVRAVLLALSVLVDEPLRYTEAAEQMLLGRLI